MSEITDKLIAEAWVAQSELSWLGGFVTTAIPDRNDLATRTIKAYNVIQDLIEWIEANANA